MKTLFIPSDFSENATTALQYAIHLSELIQARLVVFHCHQVSLNIITQANSEEEKDLLIKKDMDMSARKLQRQVKNAYNELGIKEVPAATIIGVESNPFIVEKAIEAARRQHADLMVMGTHGASGFKKLFFGSNTSIMISKSDIPVLAIPENYDFRKIKTIALASDLEDTEDELNKVMPFANALNTWLDIVHFDYGISPPGRKEQYVKSLIERSPYENIRLIMQKASVEYTLLKQLRKYLDEQKPGWLVMFTKERNFWDKILLGSKTEEMANFIELPLLSFKKRVG